MMKRKNIIIILWLLWFVSIIIMVVGVYIYIEKNVTDYILKSE